MIDVKVVIPNRNGADFLENCLSRTLKGLDGSGLVYQVVMIDNDSSDGSQEIVRQRFPMVQLVSSTPPRGFSASNNLGAGIGLPAKYLMFVNSDAYPLEGTIGKLVGFLESHPRYAAVGPLQVKPNGAVVRTSWAVYTPWRICFHECLYPLSPRVLQRAYARFISRPAEQSSWARAMKTGFVDVEWLSGFCMLVRQSTFEQIGRWDEDYSFYCEDMDLSLRLRMAGMRLAFLPDQQCVHLLSASTKTTVAVKARLEISAKALFLSKHFPGSHATLLNTFKAGDYFRGRRTPERIKWWIEILKDRGATTYDSRPT